MLTTQRFKNVSLVSLLDAVDKRVGFAALTDRELQFSHFQVTVLLSYFGYIFMIPNNVNANILLLNLNIMKIGVSWCSPVMLLLDNFILLPDGLI